MGIMRACGGQKRESGFTLLEILAVITLLAVLLTLLAPNILKNLDKGKIDAAKLQIGAMKSVLKTYYLDNSVYPGTEQGLRALLEKPAAAPVPENWNGPYLEDAKILTDPWNHAYQYAAPGTHNPQSFDLFSLGADNAEGGSGTNADIGNW